MELLHRDGVLAALTEDFPDDDAHGPAIDRFKKMGENARAHIVLNLGEEPATLRTSL